MNILKIALITMAFALFIAACGGGDTASNDTSSANSNDTTNEAASATPLDEIASGMKLYETNCARCHKENGTGGPVEIEGKQLKPDDLTSDKMKKEPDEEYLEYMRDGIPDEGMPSFKDVLDDEQMAQVVKYIREELQK